ncbi:MAG TPA: YXWGXW repeat-containing protein, partial [Candidatus Sulfobium mesophilum]|nr:YXWGXW repeat-containing protein [Candidatus Sulfobium mesophilum]
MREKDKFIIERTWSRPSKKRLRFQDTAVIRIATYVAFALLLAIGVMAAPEVSSARVAVGISVSFAPPALPVYVQPLCPGPGYIWTPGYWAWDPDLGYYWVPGTWVLAPFPGALWTPGYWGWDDGVYVWYAGYWGLAVGFYGGINYGFGYTGHGYHGGYWDHGTFYYNRSVNNVNVTNITNVYDKTVSGAMTRSRVSYNGGRGGITVRPTAAELAAARERHSAPTDVQLHNERSARLDPRQRAAVNHGKPIVAATQKPGMFSGSGVVRASRAGAPYKAPTGKTVVPGTSARPPHGGNIERGPRTAAPEHAAPPAHVERHATPGQAERSSRATKPKHA